MRPEDAGRAPPRHVLWEITRACNLRCRHCAVGAGRPAAGELSTDEALSVVDELASIAAPSVCLMGGEVFLRGDWDAIAGALRSRGIHVGLFTNGWCLDDIVLERLLALEVCQIGVSLDAATPAVHDAIRGRPGAHERALRAIRSASALASLTYRTVVTSVHRDNLGELEGIRDLLLESGPGFTWSVNIASPHSESRMPRDRCLDAGGFLRLARFVAENRPKLRGRLTLSATHDLGYFSRRFPDLHEEPWRGCLAGIETLGITAEGHLKGCLILSDRFIEANLRDVPLRAIWRDPNRFEYNRRFDPRRLRGICRDCPHGPACRGGCRDHAEAFTGSPFEAPFCLYRLEGKGAS